MSTADLENRLASLRDAAPSEQLRQLDELSTALYQAAQNVNALVRTCSTVKQTAAMRKVLDALKTVKAATEEFVDAVEVDAYDRNGQTRWSVV